MKFEQKSECGVSTLGEIFFSSAVTSVGCSLSHLFSEGDEKPE